MHTLPDFSHEKKLWAQGYHVIGVDEVGRGSFAGPLVVAAVCFSPIMSREEITSFEKMGINDSKKLKHLQRFKLAKIIQSRSFYATSSAPVNFINKHGITGATTYAVRQAVAAITQKLSNKKCFLLMDAFYIKYVRRIGLARQKAIIHGDEISLSIAASSIVAKVARDRMMRSYARKYPAYLWGINKGYGTRKHIEAIRLNGLTKLHRELYVRKISFN